MNNDTDPMQGTPDERAAYIAQMNEFMRSEMEKDRAQRRQQPRDEGGEPAIIGMTGAPGAIARVVDR